MTAFGRKKEQGRSHADGARKKGGATDVGGEASGDNPEEDHEAEEVDELAETRAALEDAEERALRARADYQNLRRRQADDIDAAVQRARAEVLGEAVTVLDYLDMALAAPVESTDAKNLKIGIEMTRGQLQALFDRMQVKPIKIEGSFDPTYHQAVSTVESDAHAPGEIVEVVRGGWMMGETVLRFAQVRVAAAPEPDAPTSGSISDPGASDGPADGDEPEGRARDDEDEAS